MGFVTNIYFIFLLSIYIYKTHKTCITEYPLRGMSLADSCRHCAPSSRSARLQGAEMLLPL
eukprot:UN04984